MKRILTVFCLLIFALPCFAEYKPIPKELSKQYKTEMESIINSNYPKAIKDIDDYFNYVQAKYNQLLKKYNEETYWSMIPEVSIYDLDLFIYSDMLKVTQEKYLKTKYDMDGSDDTTSIAEFLYPYIEANNIDTSKLIQIANYAKSKDNTIQEYSKKIDKLYSNP